MHFLKKMWFYRIASQEIKNNLCENLLKINNIENIYRKIQ